MLSELFQALVFIFQIIIKAFVYTWKGIAWYIEKSSDMIKYRPKKGNSRVHIKGEIV